MPNMWKNYQTIADRNKHRSQAASCKTQWGKENPRRNTCAIQECNRTFTTKEQLRNHERKHTHKDNYKEIYKLDPEGKVDRRRMIYHSLPTQETTMMRNLIKYNIKTREWECAKCHKSEQSQNKRNLIQHVIRARKEQERNIRKISHKTQEMNRISEIRIKTLNLDEHNPEENTEKDQEIPGETAAPQLTQEQHK